MVKNIVSTPDKAPKPTAKELAAQLQAERKQRQFLEDEVAELQQTIKELQRSNQDLEDFASIASHDLQEPLRKIMIFGDRLRAKAPQLGEAERDYLDRMFKATRRMQALIDDLLSFSRVSTKAQPFVPVNLGKVIREVLVDLEIRIKQTGGTVTFENLPTLEAEPVHMSQLLQNLIANSLKFSREGVPPEIKINASQNSLGNWVIQVQDNGIGFDEQHAERIFKPFERLHGRSAYEGRGMGLAICKKIVTHHNGDIQARSRAGEGTTFIITLPDKQAEAKPTN